VGQIVFKHISQLAFAAERKGELVECFFISCDTISQNKRLGGKSVKDSVLYETKPLHVRSVVFEENHAVDIRPTYSAVRDLFGLNVRGADELLPPHAEDDELMVDGYKLLDQIAEHAV